MRRAILPREGLCAMARLLLILCFLLAAGPLMAQTGQVPPAYTAASEALQARGRAVIDLTASGDAAALYALFSRNAAAAVSQDDLEQLLEALRAEGAVGPVLD